MEGRGQQAQYCSTRCNGRVTRFKGRYGMTAERWHSTLIAQSGRCAICAEPMTVPSVDHDHHTGRARALLCQRCNSMIGYMESSPRRVIYAALDYIRDHNYTYEAVSGAIH
jgi:hypothetical protein